MDDQHPITFKQLLISKFDNLSLILLVVFLVLLITWVDKHGNSDFEKWLEVFTAGFGGSYLTLTQAARQAWKNQNGNGSPSPPAQKIAIVAKGSQ